MDKAELKALLVKSKKEPVTCACGKGKEATSAYIRLHKTRTPPALERELEHDFADLREPRRGTATIDSEDNPRLVIIRLNRPSSGLAPRLLRILRQVGFNKLTLEYEDGSPAESHGEESEAPQPAASQPAAPDAAALRTRLTSLAQQLVAVGPATPGRDQMVALAREAQTLLAAGDLAGAEQRLVALATALTAAPQASPPPTPTPAPPAADAHVALYAKARQGWIATRHKIETDLGTLRTSLSETFADHPKLDALQQSFDAVTDPVLEALDESLADVLEAAGQAEDAAERQELVAEARTIIGEYQAFLAAEQALLADLDSNPFQPLAIGRTATATLATLASAIR